MAYIVDLDAVKTTTELAAELGITPRRIRQVAEAMGLGYLIGGLTLFTPAEAEQIHRRRTDRTPIRCWLRERAEARATGGGRT